jgi:hypothetical protein
VGWATVEDLTETLRKQLRDRVLRERRIRIAS